jgi:membrane protease YdiL (CAAX protease family)
MQECRAVTEAEEKILVSFAQSARRHPVVASLISLIGSILLVAEALHGRALELVTYLSAMVLSVVVVDVSVTYFGKLHIDFPVQVPRTETVVAAALYPLAAAIFAYRFSGLYPPHGVSSKLLFVTALFLFGFHLALALFLVWRGYGFGDLGVRFWGFAPVPLIMVVCMALVAWATPLRNTWTEVYRSLGGSMWGWIESGLLMAALPEEFFRMVWQTRFGRLLNNRAVGWLAASLLWAALHWFIFSQGRSRLETFFGLLDIIPYGLLLGYITYRTQSILPAILLHATKFVWLGKLG